MSGQTRYFISAICNWIFIILFHLHTTKHLSRAIYIRENADAIKFAYKVAADPDFYLRPDDSLPIYNGGNLIDDGYLDADQIALQEAYKEQWEVELIDFEYSGMMYVAFFYM